MEEIKSMFATIVVEKNNEAQPRKEELPIPNHPVVMTKNGKKEVEDAYRSIFMKTLKPRKENLHRQAWSRFFIYQY